MILRTLIVTLIALPLFACMPHYPVRNATGDRFPNVAGKTLAGTRVHMPDDFSGERIVVLLAYETGSLRDVVYWCVSLISTLPEARFVVIPVVVSDAPWFKQTEIMQTLRDTVPRERWDDLVLIDGWGTSIAWFTGNPASQHATLIVLDEQGQVTHINRSGFSGTSNRRMIEAFRDE